MTATIKEEYQDRRQKWIDALRSGKHKQTRGELSAVSSEDGSFAFCCLGVACDVQDDSRWSEPKAMYGGSYRTYGGAIGQPPNDQCVYYGLTDKGVQNLIRLNDALKLSFSQIADVLERQPERFFREGTF
jgi:predicted transcriptional regulator